LGERGKKNANERVQRDKEKDSTRKALILAEETDALTFKKGPWKSRVDGAGRKEIKRKES